VYWWNVNTDETCWTLPAGANGPPILNVATAALAGPGVHVTAPSTKATTAPTQPPKLTKKQKSKMRKQSAKNVKESAKNVKESAKNGKDSAAASSAPASSAGVETNNATTNAPAAVSVATKTKRTGLSLFGHSRGDSKGKAGSMELNDKLKQVRLSHIYVCMY
jgi:uncharacterized protein with WD repeat